MVTEEDYHFLVYTGWVPQGSDFSLELEKHEFSEPGLVTTLAEGQRIQDTVFSSDAGIMRFEEASREEGRTVFYAILTIEAKNLEVARERAERIYREALGKTLQKEAYDRAITLNGYGRK